MTVPHTMARLMAFESRGLIVRTTLCGRQKVKTPTSSHCVKYSPMGMLPPESGSIIWGWLAAIASMMFSQPPPALRMPPARTTMPTIMAMPQSVSVKATPRKPPSVVKRMAAMPNIANPTT